MSNSAWSGARPHIDESELLCKTGCGFYGNPAWNGHCSKCNKELQNKKKQRKGVFDPTELKNKVSRSVSDVSEFQSRASNIVSKKLDKFEEKRLQLDKRTKAVKSIFKKSPTIKAHKEEKGLLRINRQLSEESEIADVELESILQSIGKEAEQIILKNLRPFCEKTYKMAGQASVQDLGDHVQEFYFTLRDLMTSHVAFAHIDQDQLELVTDLIENYITTRLYNIFINEVNAASEEKDLIIQKRIRCLNWISASHLECKVDETSVETRKIIEEIISDLIEIDSKRISSEKLRFLVSASHRILQLLSLSSGGIPASADDFLPALILCVIRANPPLLQSNITYITNFAQPSCLQSGEDGYFFTNLCCAVSFIEKLTADSLGLTQGEFDRYMWGDALPPNALDPNYMSEGMQLMQKNVDNLCEMETKLNVILDGYDTMMEELEQYETNCIAKIDEVMKKTVFVFPKKANIDEPVPSQDLPPPLTPMVSSTNEINVHSITSSGKPEDFPFAGNVEASLSGTGGGFEDSFSNTHPSEDLISSANNSLASVVDTKDLGTSNLETTSFEAFNSKEFETSFSDSRFLESSSLDSVDFGATFQPGRTTGVSAPFNLLPSYSGFSVQGMTIQSIPCETAFSHYSDPLSPPMEHPSNLPAPILPTSFCKK